MTNFTTNTGSGGATFVSDTEGGFEVPAAKMWWGAAGSAVRVDTTTPMPMSNNATIFRFSSNNTTVAQLTAGATFTGTIETALDQPSISLLLTSDQPVTLTVKQYIDLAGTQAVPPIVFYIPASTGFSRSFTLNGNYVNVTITNNGAATTTTLSLNTAYGALNDSDPSGVQPVTELPLILTGASAQTALVNNILTPVTSGSVATTVAGFRAGSVQVVSTGTAGGYIFEQSNDNVNWVALPVFNASLVTGIPITAAVVPTASTIIYTFPIRCVYLRLRISTAVTGGSIQAFTRLSSDPWTPSATLVANSVVANLQTTATVVGDTAAAASADALANPTIKQIGADNMVFNGTSWDRQRGMSVASTTGDTGAKTATGNGATQTNVGNKGVAIVVNMGAVTGTTPTCVLKVQGSADGGTTWYDIPGATTVSLVATGVWGIIIYPGVPTVAGTTTSIAGTASCGQPLPRTWRMVWTIGGTTPSFTITNIQYNYLPN